MYAWPRRLVKGSSLPRVDKLRARLGLDGRALPVDVEGDYSPGNTRVTGD
jgi:hypothetical protein